MIAITIATAPHPRKNNGISKIVKEALVPDIIFNSVEILSLVSYMVWNDGLCVFD